MGSSSPRSPSAPDGAPDAGTLPAIATFLKWAGGKQWLARTLAPVISSGKGRYFEPFLGAGSVYFAAQPKRAFLSDKSADVIAAFEVVKTSPDNLIRQLGALTFSKTRYYRVRKSRPQGRVQRATRFIYLNRTCWNGLFRVNRDGEFNVPIGQFQYPPDFVGVERIRAAHKALRGASLKVSDFEVAVEKAELGDTVYFDPPYTAAHENNGFVRYNEHIFSWADQERLARTCQRLADLGCRVIVSNASHKTVRALYPTFIQTTVRRQSSIAADAKHRRKVAEAVLSNFPLEIGGES